MLLRCQEVYRLAINYNEAVWSEFFIVAISQGIYDQSLESVFSYQQIILCRSSLENRFFSFSQHSLAYNSNKLIHMVMIMVFSNERRQRIFICTRNNSGKRRMIPLVVDRRHLGFAAGTITTRLSIASACNCYFGRLTTINKSRYVWYDSGIREPTNQLVLILKL